MTANPLVAIRAHGTRRPLICVHPIGGHITAYAALVELLDPRQPVWGLRSRAVRDAQLEHPSVEALVADYASSIAAEHQGAYRLLGWSMGGLLAHAIACELEGRGAEVEVVGMIDPPSRVGREVEGDPLERALAMALTIFHPAPPTRGVIRQALRTLEGRRPEGSLAAWCVAHALLPDHGIPHEEFDAAAALLPIHHALLASLQLGVCRAPVTIWRARELAGLASRDWSAHTTGALTARVVGGDHFTIIRPPHVGDIAADLDALG